MTKYFILALLASILRVAAGSSFKLIQDISTSLPEWISRSFDDDGKVDGWEIFGIVACVFLGVYLVVLLVGSFIKYCKKGEDSES